MRFSEHPLRRQIVGEMHLRRFPALELPAMAFQTVRLVDENDREKEWLILQQRCASGLDRNLRHLETEWSANGRLAWERHSEAVTTTLTSTSVSADAQFWSAPDVGPFSDTLQWMETLPGLVIRATHIVVVANDSYAEPVVDRADFHPGHLVSCIIGIASGSGATFAFTPAATGAWSLPRTGRLTAKCRVPSSAFRNWAIIAIFPCLKARTDQ